jgi:Uma2 family endonuclease
MAGNDYFSTSPVLIVEVLSNSTRKRDLTTKLLQYINLPSVQEYVLIEQDIVSVQVLRRSNHWQSEYFFLGDSVTFESVDLTLTVEDVYDRVDNEDMNEFRQHPLLPEK